MFDFKIHDSNTLNAKGKFEIYRNGEFSYGRRAFTHGDRIDFHLFLPRSLGTVSVLADIINDYTGKNFEIPLSWNRIENDFDVYVTSVDTKENSERCGLYFIRFDLKTVIGRVYGQHAEYGSEIFFVKDSDKPPHTIQISISDFKYKEPKWLNGGVIYHIFVDRFYRGKDTPMRKDSILNEDWDNGIPQYPEYPGAHLENNMFFGGNLYGVADKLDYIASLGVKCIYLSPVFEAYSNHKYDTGNYMKVDDAFGGDEALNLLVSEAKKRGIYIILDGVFNHTGADSLYFNKFGKYNSVGAYQSKKSKYFSWYSFQKFPDIYTSWWGINILPRLNTHKKECTDYFVSENGVISHWADYGIAGFRLDVVDELPDDFVANIKSILNEKNDCSILYGEVWEDASNKIAYDVRKKYYMGNELDGVMNYPVRTGIIDFLRRRKTEALKHALLNVLPNTPKRIADLQMNILGTHDTERIITALAGPDSIGKSNDELAVFKMSHNDYMRGVKLLKIAYMILSTIPGIPTVYYGDEIGMQGYKDPFNRMPYNWKNPDEDLRSFYICMAKIRSENAIYKDGEFELIWLDEDLLVFSRENKKRSFITVVNNSTRNLYINAKNSVSVFGITGSKKKMIIKTQCGGIFSIKIQDRKDISFTFE